MGINTRLHIVYRRVYFRSWSSKNVYRGYTCKSFTLERAKTHGLQREKKKKETLPYVDASEVSHNWTLKAPKMGLNSQTQKGSQNSVESDIHLQNSLLILHQFYFFKVYTQQTLYFFTLKIFWQENKMAKIGWAYTKIIERYIHKHAHVISVWHFKLKVICREEYKQKYLGRAFRSGIEDLNGKILITYIWGQKLCRKTLCLL